MKICDLQARLAAKKEPKAIRFDDTHIYTVNTSKNTFISILGDAKEMQDSANSDPVKAFKSIDKIIEKALGKDAVKYLDGCDMAMDDYMTVINAIMAVYNGESLEDYEKN